MVCSIMMCPDTDSIKTLWIRALLTFQNDVPRCRFTRVPLVGSATAEAWYRAGHRSYEDLVAALGKGSLCGPGGRRLSCDERWCIEHWQQLAAAVPAGQVEQLLQVGPRRPVVALPVAWRMRQAAGGRWLWCFNWSLPQHKAPVSMNRLYLCAPPPARSPASQAGRPRWWQVAQALNQLMNRLPLPAAAGRTLCRLRGLWPVRLAGDPCGQLPQGRCTRP
jgi:hypothetical protein